MNWAWALLSPHLTVKESCRTAHRWSIFSLPLLPARLEQSSAPRRTVYLGYTSPRRKIPHCNWPQWVTGCMTLRARDHWFVELGHGTLILYKYMSYFPVISGVIIAFVDLSIRLYCTFYISCPPKRNKCFFITNKIQLIIDVLMYTCFFFTDKLQLPVIIGVNSINMKLC